MLQNLKSELELKVSNAEQSLFDGLSYSVTCNIIVIIFIIKSLLLPDVIPIINVRE